MSYKRIHLILLMLTLIVGVIYLFIPKNLKATIFGTCKRQLIAEDTIKTIQWNLEKAEEVEPPHLKWRKKIKNDYIHDSSMLDKQLEKKLVEEKPSLTEFLSDRSLSPFFLLKGSEKQYLINIKGEIKEIPYPSNAMIIKFDKKSLKVEAKTKDGNALWEREWEIKYEQALISPDGSWIVLSPIPDSEWGLTSGENIVAVNKNGEELWRAVLSTKWDQAGLSGWPKFSENGNRLAFGARNFLYYASKENILWQKRLHGMFEWHNLNISPSGNFIILPGVKLIFLNHKGAVLYQIDNFEELVPWKYGFSKKEKYIFILGFKKTPRRSPFFIAVLDVEKGKVVKKTKAWINYESPDFSKIFMHASFIKVCKNKYLLVCFPEKKASEIHLYEISHILKDEKGEN
jgi:hypothetical protein